MSPPGRTSSKGTSPELTHAIANAEIAMKALSLATNAEEKQRLTEQVKQCLAIAEQLKHQKAKPDDLAIFHKEPATTRPMPKSEQILLLKSSFLNGSKFPPWAGEPSVADFVLKENEMLYTDDAAFSLSTVQQKVFAGWERPDVALAVTTPLEHTSAFKATMDHVNTIDLVQDASTDCSVVASLCAGVARALKGHSRLLKPVLFPRHPDTGVPTLSGNGKYIVRLNFNGCYRRVVIDDRLPKSKTERVIHVIDRVNPMLLWPALVEKAYLKIRGGYDFPGSNSATDLWIITGWVPEQVFLQSDDLDLDGFWKRMSDAFGYGDVLVTMGTGKMSKKLEKEVGLAGEHDYAVIDMKEVRGQRLMLVKNPWCEGTNWYRVPRRQSKVNLDLLAEQDPTIDEDPLALQSPRDLLNANEQLSPGTFWMDINNAAQYFESIYLNWNPGLFTARQDLHFGWDLSGDEVGTTRGDHASVRHNPQFSISAQDGGTIWILLCRHLSNAAKDSGATYIDLAGFIALSAFNAGGKRINLAGRALSRSSFVDSPQMLLKLQDCLPGVDCTILPLEQELSPINHTFTISAFGTSAIKLEHAPAAHPYAVKSSSSWTRDSAGGNAHSPTYSSNPQFTITITRATKVSLLLETTNEVLNVHVKMVYGRGKRVRGVRSRDIVFDSSDYRRRCCAARSRDLIEPGAYTIICSTYEPQQFGKFDLLLESDEPVILLPLPGENAGRLLTVVVATFSRNVAKIATKLTPKRIANLYINAKPVVNSPTTPLRMSIEQGTGIHRRVLTSSEDDDHIGTESARLDEFDITPSMLRYGEIWLVLERVCIADQNEELAITMDCWIDQLEAVDFGEWVVLDL
ncbi:hypothetical protein AMS68_006501 [Peltaster fructicola]|uniref:Calpain catalytic domain-containing protein n=1 Tax=Peltaster fructicola TaxID=286661 RepID=A0A6H0Y1V3_9PEZI|nr:hypothetical protein AMS68_006501 [Peltaster fructicola]